jgi:hypothetical protein
MPMIVNLFPLFCPGEGNNIIGDFYDFYKKVLCVLADFRINANDILWTIFSIIEQWLEFRNIFSKSTLQKFMFNNQKERLRLKTPGRNHEKSVARSRITCGHSPNIRTVWKIAVIQSARSHWPSARAPLSLHPMKMMGKWRREHWRMLSTLSRIYIVAAGWHQIIRNFACPLVIRHSGCWRRVRGGHLRHRRLLMEARNERKSDSRTAQVWAEFLVFRLTFRRFVGILTVSWRFK